MRIKRTLPKRVQEKQETNNRNPRLYVQTKTKELSIPLMHGCWKQDGGSVMTWGGQRRGYQEDICQSGNKGTTPRVSGLSRRSWDLCEDGVWE